MKLVKTKYKLRCEIGGCRNFADYVLYIDRCGVHSSIYMCSECLDELKNTLKNDCEDNVDTEERLVASDVMLAADDGSHDNGTMSENTESFAGINSADVKIAKKRAKRRVSCGEAAE